MAMPANWAKALVVFKSPTNEYFINVLWYILEGPPDSPATFPGALADMLFTALTDPVTEALTAESSMETVVVSQNSGGVVYTGQTAGSPVFGDITDTQPLPAFNAVVIQKRTAVPGKSGRGRWYFPLIPETLVGNNSIDPADLDKYTSIMEEYTSGRVVSGLSCTAAHHSAKNDSLTEIIFSRVDPVVGTQRGRKFRLIGS